MRRYELSGVTYMLLSCFMYSLMYCVARLTSTSIDPMVMVFYRNLFTIILMLPFLLIVYKPKYIITSFNRSNLLRGIFGFTSIYSFFKALSGMIVTKVVAISFITPLISSTLAVIILKEKLSLNKGIALSLGLIGAYIILMPSVGNIDIYVCFAILSCFSWACSNIIIKRLTKVQPTTLIVFYLSCINTVISFPWIINKLAIAHSQLLLLLVIAALSTVSQIFLAKAFEQSDITKLMPFDFTRLVFSAIIAYIMFGELLQTNTFIGSLVVVTAVSIAIKKFKAL